MFRLRVVALANQLQRLGERNAFYEERVPVKGIICPFRVPTPKRFILLSAARTGPIMVLEAAAAYSGLVGSAAPNGRRMLAGPYPHDVVGTLFWDVSISSVFLFFYLVQPAVVVAVVGVRGVCGGLAKGWNRTRSLSIL